MLEYFGNSWNVFNIVHGSKEGNQKNKRVCKIEPRCFGCS